jgi:hypothetical protein
MSLNIVGTDSCWVVLHDLLKQNYPHLCDKNITISINCESLIPNTKNIIWLHESPALVNNIVDKIKNNTYYYISNNIIVYTSIDELQKYTFVKYVHPSNSTWIQNPSFMPVKNKLVSMISSNKNFTNGHQFRHNIINNLPICVDLYGRGFREIENKSEGLKDYCFSIAIENDDTNSYFSEKLLDCFLTCTIPIYWGAEAVDNIFNKDGIIRIKSISDICSLTYLDYNNKIEAIQDNYQKALEQNISPLESLINILEEN